MSTLKSKIITSNNKRIAKNTFALYLRMFLSLSLNLYTSRIILEVLGVSDFGIYNLVGGIITLLAFLNTAMSGATSRFLTFDIGLNNLSNLQKTFNSTVQIHLAIAFLILIFGESLGVWFINAQLNIPDNRTFDTNIVYQMSLLTSMVTITQVPYSAAIIAYEKMNVYAYIEIASVILKFLSVICLMFLDHSLLIMYSVFLFIASIVITFLYRIYTSKVLKLNFYTFSINMDSFMPLIKFSGYDLYGNACGIIQGQGINILINKFFGIAINGAAGIATQVKSVSSLFCNNIIMAFRPQIIKEYAAGNYIRMQQLICMAIVLSLLMVALIISPLINNLNFVMTIWLHDVPIWSVELAKIMLLESPIGIINGIIVIGIHATGNIKNLSFKSGSLYLCTVIITFILFYIGKTVVYAYITLLSVSIIVTIYNCHLLNKQINGINIKNILTTIIKMFTITIIAYYVMTILQVSQFPNWLNLIINLISNSFLLILLTLVEFKAIRISLIEFIFKRSKL